MLADKKRIAVTVAGVTGCCALIVTGFTIKSAVKGCVDKQYTEIVGFDEKIRFNTVKAGEEIEELLKDEMLSYLPVSESIISYRMGDDTFGKLVCGELDKLKGFYNIYDWKSGRELSLSGDGIYIQRRIAEIYNLSCGDEIMIMNSALQSGKVKISGIFENYIGSMVFMNTESYYDVFHSTSEPDVFLVRLGGKDKEKLLGALEKIEGFEKMEAAGSERTVFESVLGKKPLLFVARYPQSTDLRRWLQAIPNKYYHFGDFDLAGIHIFLTEFHHYLGDRSTYLIPSDIEQRLSKGSLTRYNEQYDKYHTLQCDIPYLQSLIDMINKHHRGYDQEGYINNEK